jgi:Predicted thioesterase
MSEFPWTTHEHVRFSDCDPMGHANNAVYSTYLEQARIARSVGSTRSSSRASRSTSAPSCAQATSSRSAHAVPSVGTKSFELEHEIWAGNRLAAEAKSVLVGYDYESGASVPLSDDIKRRLSA